MAKRYTKEEIAILGNNPNVKYVNENRLVLIYEFRVEIYTAWKRCSTHTTVRNIFEENGIPYRVVGREYIKHIILAFKRHGRPKGAKNSSYGTVAQIGSANTNDEQLLATGRFIAGINGRGISFHPDFANELYSLYPETTIYEGLRRAGINPEMVGYQRIYTLKRMFDGTNVKPDMKSCYGDEAICKLSHHPYIKKISAKQCSIHPAFYNDGLALSGLHIDEILHIFELEPTLFTVSYRNKLRNKFNTWSKTNHEITDVTRTYLTICRNRMIALERLTSISFALIKQKVPILRGDERKMLCKWIQQLPEDPSGQFTIRTTLDKVGMSKSSYYAILKNHDYGKREEERMVNDEHDVTLIRNVLSYKGFAKGARQVYMQMQDVTGKQFGLNKIRRLMKKYDLHTDIRKANQSRKNALEFLNRNKKPNLVKRRFRLYRPNALYLTDVTYLDYGAEQRAYGSAAIDPVTGRLITLLAGGSNDLELALTTLQSLTVAQVSQDVILHSDQGTLYLNETFQRAAKEAGFIQSMSKRGNCCDNAPQESFFGHFKDECPYQEAETLEELKKMLADYAYYYNNERKQWSRKRMTPVAFERHLLDMTEDAFAAYLATEQEKYNNMKNRAEQKAIERAKCLGVDGIHPEREDSHEQQEKKIQQPRTTDL